MIQSGLSRIAEQAGIFFQNEAMKYIRRYNLEPEVAIVGFGYRFYKNRSFSFRLNSKTITVSPDFINNNYSLGVSWNF